MSEKNMHGAKTWRNLGQSHANKSIVCATDVRKAQTQKVEVEPKRRGNVNPGARALADNSHATPRLAGICR